MIKKTIKYAKEDTLALDVANAPLLMALSPKNKHNAMTALANLDKTL